GFELIRHAEADVLPGKAELPCDIFKRWVIGRIVETTQPLCRVLAKIRVGGEKCMDELGSVFGESAEPLLDSLQSGDREQMDSDLERKADVVKEPPDFAIEPTERLHPSRIDQLF